jgi:hypothetical protein
MLMTPQPLNPNARLLGYAGLLPQALAVLMLFDGTEMLWIATAGAFGYAAFIFSFLGGTWWTIGMMNPAAPKWIFAAAIAPSLIALITFLPWTWGWSWPGPSLAILAIGLLLSPIIDSRISASVTLPAGWLRLRWHLSIGLGVMTAVLAVAALV